METVSLSLTPLLREHMRQRVASGHFTSEGDYLQRLVAIDRERVEAMNAAIQEGLDSGISERSIDEIFEDAKRRHFATEA